MFLDFFHYLTDLIYPKGPVITRLETLDGVGLIKELPASNLNGPWTRAVFNYKDSRVRALIWEIKYRGNKKLIARAAEALLISLRGMRPPNELFLLPIPMHAGRRRTRGFNQSALLVEAMLRKDINLKNGEGIVEKIRHTEAQSTLPRGKRKINLVGAFRVVNPSLVTDKDFLLIDDVTTTGATFSEISKVLREAGARSVAVLALAH